MNEIQIALMILLVHGKPVCEPEARQLFEEGGVKQIQLTNLMLLGYVQMTGVRVKWKVNNMYGQPGYLALYYKPQNKTSIEHPTYEVTELGKEQVRG